MAETDMSKLYENLPDNSHKSRNENKTVENNKVEKRAEKVVHGKVKTKTNNARKLTDIFISEDVSNVKNYIIMDVIVPSIKKAVYDLIVGTLDMSLYGGRGNGGKRPTADKISYRDYNNVNRRDDRSYGSTRTASGYTYDDIVVETRGEAESVLARMDEIMEEYEQVRVADLYDLVGISGDYTDNKYGWTNIRNARVVRTRDGYKIEMPRAIALK
jgi:hypothetical protein